MPDSQRITLCPVPPTPGLPGTPVGRVGHIGVARLSRRMPTMGAVLSYEGRQAYVDGVAVEHEDIRDRFFEAVVEATTRLWGDLWVAPLIAVTGFGHRTAQRDRILRSGLPVPVLRLLGTASWTPYPRAVGYQLLAVASMWDALGKDDEGHQRSGVLAHSEREDLDNRLQEVLRASQVLVAEIREETDRARRLRQEKSRED